MYSVIYITPIYNVKMSCYGYCFSKNSEYCIVNDQLNKTFCLSTQNVAISDIQANVDTRRLIQARLLSMQ